ncbi:MAG TPA: HAD-IIA family hydrolase [Acidimicrobiales bacterium]|nr:HAD-IIA family hydrolase [Acidimicrobiales bacterium]
MLWLLDLDGVVWLTGRPIPGSADAVARLRSAGDRVAFLTNNSGPTLDEYVKMLGDAGIEAEAGEMVTSANAAASMLAPGSTAAVVGDAGIDEALAEQGVEVVRAADGPDAVVVGRSVALDYNELAAAATAIRAGARFVATNADATFPTPDGLLPGAGAMVAFLQAASGREPEVAGKPNQPVADLVASRYGHVDVVVGDRPDTDGRFAHLVGSRFVLVLTGVTSKSDLPVEPEPDTVSDDLAAAVSTLLEPPP